MYLAFLISSKIGQEERIIRVLSEYYSSNDLYIPPRFPGAELPTAFYNFYDDILRELVLDMARHEETETKKHHAPHATTERKSKKAKFMHSHSKSPPKDDSEKNVQSTSKLKEHLYENKTIAEIEELMLAYINEKLLFRSQTIMSDSYFKDPIKTAIIESKGPVIEPDSTSEKEGIVILFHGAPLTEYIWAANRLAKYCQLSLVTLDSLIFEALVQNKTENCVKINEYIEAAYNKIVNPTLAIDLEEGKYEIFVQTY